MILHVNFTDGSNPWVSFAHDPRTIAKQWRKWTKNHPNTARPVVFCNGKECRPVAGGGYAVAVHFDGAHTTKHYSRLGNALNALAKEANA